MSKTDFQNGFALGMASGGVVSIDEQAIATALAEFKEKEIPWKRNYKYNAAELKEKLVYGGEPAYKIEFRKQERQNEELQVVGYVAEITCTVIIAQVREDLEYLVETPLKVEFKRRGDGYLDFNIPNLDGLYDAGIYVEGDFIPFSYLIEAFVDGDNFTEGSVTFNETETSSRYGQGIVGVHATLRIYSPSEEAIDYLLAEFEPIFEAYGDTFVHCYEHTPEIETVEAHYIGG